jgi:adenylate kinase family enzyme
MIILITGASHTGKTLLAQKLLEKYHYPYLSIDHLKMGLIRSGQTDLTPYDDDKLTDYLWSIIKEMIKTAIENKQNLIVEGCYIPFNWKDSFDEEYLSQIKYICLVMSESYIDDHFSDIIGNENVIEKRLPNEDFTIQFVKQENEYYLKTCTQYGLDYILIDTGYFENVRAGVDRIMK